MYLMFRKQVEEVEKKTRTKKRQPNVLAEKNDRKAGKVIGPSL